MYDVIFADVANKTYASITANGKWLCRDFGMKIKSIEIEPPEVWEHIREIPGRLEPIDLTEFTGMPAYKQREVKITLDQNEDYEAWLQSAEIRNFLHGKLRNFIILPDDEHFFTGRCTFESSKGNPMITEYVITVNCYPMRTILPTFEELCTNVDMVGVTSGAYKYILCRIGHYAKNLVVEITPIEGMSIDTYVVIKNLVTNKQKSISIRSSSVVVIADTKISGEQFIGNIQIGVQAGTISKFSLKCELNKEI